MEKTPEELYGERKSRVQDSIQLKVPDRVPILINFGFFAARYAGITCERAFYDYGKWRNAYKKTIFDFKPDMYRLVQFPSGAVLETLDCKMAKWPGHGVPPDQPWQFIDQEFMKEDDYDAFMTDPSDFAIRTFIPRVYAALEPLKGLPPLRSMLFGLRSASLTAVLAMPQFANAFESLLKAGREALKWRSGMSSFDNEMAELGWPSLNGGTAYAPFDIISDYFRGMRGTMLDMYRRPDKLMESCEKLLPMMIEWGVSGAKMSGDNAVFMPLHRGSHGFMSPKQFKIFYWPTLKKLLLALVDKGLTPCPFFEGDCTSILHHIAELPRGKILAQFDATDLFKAKEILRDRICIAGNVPLSLLQAGSTQDVKNYCKRLIDVVGKGGGFIMSPSGVLDGPKPENVKAMVDLTKEYGVYH